LHEHNRFARRIGETIAHADHLLIQNVAVSPDFQGRGFGRQLLTHAEQLAASLGHDEIRLYTNKLFAANLVLYGRLGYRVDREEEFKGLVLLVAQGLPEGVTATAGMAEEPREAPEGSAPDAIESPIETMRMSFTTIWPESLAVLPSAVLTAIAESAS
jgi:hypothetical protein